MSGKKIFTSLISAAFVALAVGSQTGYVSAQDSDSYDPEIFRTDDDKIGADSLSGRLMLRIPDGDGSGAGDGGPGSEGSQPPSEPSGPGSETGDPPEFFGEPVGGKLIFVLDVSLSMQVKDVGGGEDYDGNAVGNMSRIDAVKYETVKMLKSFTTGDEFNFVLLAGAEENGPGGKQSKPITDVWKEGGLVEGSDDVVEEAIQFVKDLTLWWGTPTFVALQRACQEFGDEMDKYVFLSDGAPYPPTSYGNGPQGHKQAIMENFPGWYAKIKSSGCKLVCVHIGQNKNAGTFMQDFASANGGQYYHK